MLPLPFIKYTSILLPAYVGFFVTVVVTFVDPQSGTLSSFGVLTTGRSSIVCRVLTTLENLENSGNFLILENSGNFKFTQGIFVSMIVGIEFCA